MGRKDISTKKYLSNPNRFADVFNAFLFDGEQIVSATELKDVDTTQVTVIPVSEVGRSRRSYHKQKFRDIIREAVIKSDDQVTYVLLGIENQSEIHYAMPARNMLYNALSYDRQICEILARHKEENEEAPEKPDSYLSGFQKEDRLLPVITLTLYWGDDPWDGPRTLKEMLAYYPKRLDPYIDDIEINLFSITDDETYLKCTTELKAVFEALHYRNDQEKFQKLLLSSDYQALNREEAEIISEFSGIPMPRKTPKGGYNMCKAVEGLRQQFIQQGMQQGIRQGQEEMVFSMRLNGYIDDDIAANSLKLSKSAFRTKLKDYIEAQEQNTVVTATH